MDDDDDDEIGRGLYENGHWEWSDGLGCLIFKSELPNEIDYFATQSNVIGTIEFKDDMDLIEQQRFRKRFQRKTAPDDVVTLQDVKDLVLYTSPKGIVTPSLVNLLHLPMTERFLRALIIYCQYFVQISDEMCRRISELQTKVRTIRSNEIELVFRDNLEDLRVVVAKEYCSLIMGAEDFAKYHHMGPLKTTRSLSKTEAFLFESLLRISTQIVWLALGRRSYNQIEIEVHRIFKSHIYNIIEHKLKYKYREEMHPREYFTLFGHCLKPGRKTNIVSPLMSEVQCTRDVDYRLLGLGTVKYDQLNPRLKFFERILIEPESELKRYDISIGILGIERSKFDTMLKEIKCPTSKTTSSQNIKQTGSKVIASSSSSIKGAFLSPPLYKDIVIPEKSDKSSFQVNESFPTQRVPRQPCNREQHKKWLEQAKRHVIKRRSTAQRGRARSNRYCQGDFCLY